MKTTYDFIKDKVKKNNQKVDIDNEYKKWIRKIAQEKTLKELIKHFREHVCSHYDRFDRSKPLNRDTWLLDVFNFINIFSQTRLKITNEDLLFKLALHYRKHKRGPKPEFDVNKFISNYKGRYKKFDLLSLNDRRTNKKHLKNLEK